MDDELSAWSLDITADTGPLRRSLEDAGRLGDQFASRLTSAFDQVAIRGRRLEDVVRSLALSISNMALNAALKPFESAIGDVFGGIFSGLSGALGASAGKALPVPFAKGGVIASPITFPIGSATGLAGERGAEAIMPLARGPGGELGVRAQAAPAVNVTFNITTPDAQSFRRSETQIAALLSRSLGQGQRNL